MTTQPEQLLENNLVNQLKSLGYQYVEIREEADMLANLQSQLEKHNNTKLTTDAFFQVMMHQMQAPEKCDWENITTPFPTSQRSSTGWKHA